MRTAHEEAPNVLTCSVLLADGFVNEAQERGNCQFEVLLRRILFLAMRLLKKCQIEGN
jgi:hypothetical protein